MVIHLPANNAVGFATLHEEVEKAFDRTSFGVALRSSLPSEAEE
jgi:hypothetical protein